MISIQPVESQKDLKRFVEFPYRHYRSAPYWVPPIQKMEYGNLRPELNPAFEHSDVQLWLARKNGQVVGRLAGIINHLETEHLGAIHARFGWLDFTDDFEVSSALFETFEAWARMRGAGLIKGPMGFTNLDASGITVEGFEELGTISGAYNYPYYAVHLEQLGFEKQMDWLEQVIEQVPRGVPDKLKLLKPVIEQKYGIRQQQFKTKDELKARLREFFKLIDKTYNKLPVYVPLSEKQVEKYIRQYINLLHLPYVSFITDSDDRIISFGVCIPAFSEAMQRAKGKLFPFGFLHLLWARKRHKTIDLILVGVAEPWRGKGLNALIFGSIIAEVNKAGVDLVRVNPILEENAASLALFHDYHPRQFRRRRLYGKKI